MRKFILLAALLLSALSMVAKDPIDTVTTTMVSGNWTATYYGNSYKGSRRNANGEPFNKNAMTCAAPKKIPFGTRLKVTNIANGKSVIVKVCDRCVGNTIIDLTHGAFGKIAKYSEGRVKVKVEVVK